MIIRSLILFLLVTLFNTQATIAQFKKDKVVRIKQFFADINKTANLTKLILKEGEFLDHMPDGGASLTGYFKNKTLLKINEWVGLSYGTLEIEYYFDKAQVIFAYVREKHFALTDSGIDYNKLERKFEGRYYFENDQLIDVKTNGMGLWSSGQDSSLPITEDANRFSKLLLSRVK